MNSLEFEDVRRPENKIQNNTFNHKHKRHFERSIKKEDYKQNQNEVMLQVHNVGLDQNKTLI